MKKRELLNLLREEGWKAGIDTGEVYAEKNIDDRIVQMLPEVKNG